MLDGATMLTSKVMSCQTHAIGKAIRPIFADPVTYNEILQKVRIQLV